MFTMRSMAGATYLALGAVLGAVPAAPAVAQGGAVLAANLFGTEVEGGEGAGERATGDFNGLVSPSGRQLCYYLEADGIPDDVTEAHIHKGARGEVGEALVTLEMAEMDEACVTVAPELVAAMVRNPKDYYIDIHTGGHAAGAVRGQLKGD